MYYLLSYEIEDEKKDMYFKGPLYNKNQDKVDNVFMFSSGSALDANEIQAPFTMILDEKQSSIKNKKQKDKIASSTVGAGILFLISPAAKAFFEKLKIDNVQYFAVSVKSKSLEVRDYKIVNITDKIDCADLSASDIVIDSDNEISSISSLVLDEAKVPKDKKIFLLARRSTAIIIVHEDLKKSIEEAGLMGFRFVELTDAGQLY
jgi:hypothetical protein